MGFFTTRKRGELDKVAEVAGEVREFVRQQEESRVDGQYVATRLVSLLERVTERSVQEIDTLTAQLRAMREELQSQAERVQRDIVEYATFSQSTVQSTKIIAENLARWKRPRTAASPPSAGPSSAGASAGSA